MGSIFGRRRLALPSGPGGGSGTSSGSNVRSGRQRLVGGQRGIGQAEHAVLLDGGADALAPGQHAQLPLELPIARLFLLFSREHEVQSPGQRVDEVGFDLGRKVGLLLQEAARGGIVAPPGLEQAAVRGRIVPRLDRPAGSVAGPGA